MVSGGRDSPESRDSAWLAVIPVSVALVLGALLLPRRAAPDTVPLPVPDGAALGHALAADSELAAKARRETLPGTVRALGSAVRAFHTLEARDAPGHEMSSARAAVDAALVDVLRDGVEPLLELRAVQLEAFLVEAARFDATGDRTPELDALAGSFVRSLTLEGWCEGHHLLPDPVSLRVMYKHMWNAFLGLDGRAELRPSLDEERVFYAFTLSHPHPSRAMRDALAAARRGARDARACLAIDEAEKAATEAWRLDRISRLAAIDPAYPADYARGVASFRRGDFGASAKSFEAWLQAHPRGPLSLRAQNFLRAAAAADRAE